MKMCRLCAFDRNDDTMERCRQCGGDLAPADEEDDDEVGADSAFFHYLVVPGVGPIELVPGRAFRIGRDARNDLVIPKATSDVHAELFWTEDYDEATIRDCGSPTGTQVDGQRIVGTRTLKGGEEITLRPLVLSYKRLAEPIEGAVELKRQARKPGVATPVPTGPPSDAQGVRRGQITRGPPPPPSDPRRRVGARPVEVLLALETARRSGTLRVATLRGRGFVSIVQGEPRHAAWGRNTGLEALLAILALDRARCSMKIGVPGRGPGQKIETTIKRAVAELERRKSGQWPGRPAASPPPRPQAPPPPPRIQRGPPPPPMPPPRRGPPPRPSR